MSAPRLSALVITRDEELGIARCLAALSFCDEIVLVDSESTDGTVAIARRFTDRVWVLPWRGYSAQKQFALEKCRGEWVLWIDADEIVTPELAAAIRGVVDATGTRGNVEADGYEVARRVRYLGAWIRHGGWGEDWVLRLFRRECGRFSPDQVHERVVLSEGARVRRLSGVLEHHTYRDLAHHWSKIERLAELGADQAFERGRRARILDLWFRPGVRAAKIYLWRRGFLDGWRGIIVAGMGAAYVFLKYSKLRAKEKDG